MRDVQAVFYGGPVQTRGFLVDGNVCYNTANAKWCKYSAENSHGHGAAKTYSDGLRLENQNFMERKCSWVLKG